MTKTTDKNSTRLADHTSGIRLRVDQLEAVARLSEIDPEMNLTDAVRRGLDMFLASQADLLTQAAARQLQPMSPARAFQSISAALARGSLSTPRDDNGRRKKQ